MNAEAAAWCTVVGAGMGLCDLKAKLVIFTLPQLAGTVLTEDGDLWKDVVDAIERF